MSSDGLGGHVCIVSSAAGLISLPGAASQIRVIKMGSILEGGSNFIQMCGNFQRFPLSLFTLAYPCKNRNLDDFCCQSEKKGLREVLGTSLEQFHGLRIQIG